MSQSLSRSILAKFPAKSILTNTNKSLANNAVAAGATQFMPKRNYRGRGDVGRSVPSFFAAQSDLFNLFNDFDRLANSLFSFNRALGSERRGINEDDADRGGRLTTTEERADIPIGETGRSADQGSGALGAIDTAPLTSPVPANLDFLRNWDPTATSGVKLDLD